MRELYCSDCGRWIEANRTTDNAIPTHDRAPPCRWICPGSNRLADVERIDGKEDLIEDGGKEGGGK